MREMINFTDGCKLGHYIYPKGMMNLQCAFHHVITTNSYRQWESKDNVTVLNVWENF